jgi:hypothetical protein
LKGSRVVADMISQRMPPEHGIRVGRNDWSMIAGVLLSALALAYAAAAAHARLTFHGSYAAGARSFFFPLKLFVIAVSPALFGFILIYWERFVLSKSALKHIRNLVLFGVGLLLAAWVAAGFK